MALKTDVENLKIDSKTKRKPVQRVSSVQAPDGGLTEANMKCPPWLMCPAKPKHAMFWFLLLCADGKMNVCESLLHIVSFERGGRD